MDAVPHVNPAANPAVAPRQQQIANPVTEVAGQILFSIGIIFATVPIWSFFAAVVVPNPYLIAIGGLAFCALGIKLLIDNIIPPQPAPPAPPPRYQRQRSLSLDGTEQFKRSCLPETPDTSPKHKRRPRSGSHGDIGKMAAPPLWDVALDPALHVKELEELENDTQIRRLLKETLEQARQQIRTEPMDGAFGCNIVVLPKPIEPFPVLHLHGCDIGMASADNALCPETFICEAIKFKNTLSGEDVEDRTPIAFAGAVIAIATGYGDPETMSFIQENLAPTLQGELEQRRLTERGIFNSLNHTFAKLDIQCFTQRQSGAATLLVSLFLGKRLWVATIGEHRAFFISKELLDKTRDILIQQQKFEEYFTPHTPRPKRPDHGRINTPFASPAKLRSDGVPESEFKDSSSEREKTRTLAYNDITEDDRLLDRQFEALRLENAAISADEPLLAVEEHDRPKLSQPYETLFPVEEHDRPKMSQPYETLFPVEEHDRSKLPPHDEPLPAVEQHERSPLPQRPEPIPFPQGLSLPTSFLTKSFQKERGVGSSPSFKIAVHANQWDESHFIGGHHEDPKQTWASPNITYIKLEKEGFLVFGSVGFGTPWAPSRYVLKYLVENEKESVENLARELVEIVCRAGSFFNVTAIVAKVTSRTLRIAVGEK